MQKLPRPIFTPPSAREEKPQFSQLPEQIIVQIEDLLSARIAQGQIVYGSLSSSAGFMLTLQNGRKVFAKGSHPQEMSHATLHIESEIRAYQSLPVLRDIAPAFIGCVSDGTEDGWTLGLWEYIESSGAEIAAAEGPMSILAQMQKTAVPEGVLPTALQHNYISAFFCDEKKWRRVESDAKVRQKFLMQFEDPAVADAWLRRNADRLIALQSEATLGACGFSRIGLMHGDLRLDNIIAGKDRFYIVDWPNANIGPLVFDVLMLAAHIDAMGQASIEQALDTYLAAGGTAFAQANDAEIFKMAGSMSGYFADQIYRSVPAKLPRLRWMQKSLFFSILMFLARAGKIESPPRMQGQSGFDSAII